MIISILISTLFVCQFSLTDSKQCKKINNCICDFDDDSGMIDLSNIGNTDGTPLFLDHFSSGDDFVYSYNPCGPFTEANCENVAACQYSTYYLIGYDIGVPDKVSFNYDGLNVVADYVSQDGSRQSFVTLVCDPAASVPTLDVTGEGDTTKYYMTMTAAAACTVPSAYGSGSGISAGSVLLIVFFTLLAVYVAASLAFNKFKRGANGKELIPNLEFWTKIPGLIMDGNRFILGLVCRRSVYSSV